MSSMNSSLEVRQIIDDLMNKHGFRHNYQVADYFGITAQTLSGWLKNNSIPHKHLLKIQNVINKTVKDKEVEDDYNKKIIRLIYNKGNIIFLGCLLTMFFSFTYFKFFAVPVYTSEASVIPVNNSGNDLAGLSGAVAQMGLNLPGNTQTSIAWDELFFEILKSNGVQRKLLDEKFTIENLAESEYLATILKKHLKVSRKKAGIQKLKINKYLKNRIRVSKTRFSPLIKIQADAFSADLSAQIIKKLIQISNEMQVNIKTRQMGQKRLFIEERIESVKVDLGLAEGKLKLFQERNRRSGKSPSLLLEESRLARDVALQNNLYLTLKTQYEEAKIEEVERTPMVETVDEAIPPIEKAGPSTLVNTFMLTIFSFVILFIVFFIKENYYPFTV